MALNFNLGRSLLETVAVLCACSVLLILIAGIREAAASPANARPFHIVHVVCNVDFDYLRYKYFAVVCV